MQVVRDLHAERHRKRRALHAAHSHAHSAASSAVRHPRDEKIVRRQDQRAFRRAELHLRPRMIAHRRTRAVNGDFSARQRRRRFHALDFWRAHSFAKFVQPYRVVAPAGLGEQCVLESRRPRDPQTNRGINSGHPIVCHDSPAAGQGLGLTRGKRFPNIERSKKYKTHQQIFPV